MQRSIVLSAILASSALATPTPAATYSCVEFDVPMSFNATTLEPSFPPFQDHYQSVAFLNRLSSRNSSHLGSPFSGSNNNTQIDVTIAAEYCAPTKNALTTVQIASHGLGFDRSYWSFGGPNSQYNYIKAATNAGYPVLSYDRLGNGKSTKSDPYSVNQLQVETQVLAILTTLLREGALPASSHIPKPDKVVHVGHSFGSMLSDALVASAPTLSDGLILTGFSAEKASIDLTISSNLHLAKENQPKRFHNLSTGYLTWGDQLSNQYSFFQYPYFAKDVLAKAEATKWPFSIGELLTVAQPEAPEFTGPVLVLTGEYDLVFCTSDCTGLLDKVKPLFPKASVFESHIQPNTGHGLNLHYNATGAYIVVSDFLGRHLSG